MIESKPIRRFVALGAPALAVAFIWIILVAPIRDSFHTMDEDIAARRYLLGKLTGALTRVGYSQERASDAVAKLDRSELLEAAPDAVMAASLQSRVAELARQQGLQIQTMQVLPARTDSAVKWIGLGVAVNGSFESIAKLLATIEEGKPYLFIERLTLNAQGASSSEGTPPSLIADFEVYGAILKERAQ